MLELVPHGPLRPVEVFGPCTEPGLHLLLRCGERFGKRRAGGAFLLRRRPAPLVGDAALLLDQLRRRLGAGASERPLELGGAVGSFLLDHAIEALLG